MPDYSRPSGEYFNNGYCCAEAVLLETSETAQINSELIPKIATGFCSGLAKTDSLCGALTGGIICINLFSGRSNPNEDRDLNYALIQRLTEFFKTEFGATYCSEVCGYNISTVEGNKEYHLNNKKAYCTTVVEKTSEFLIRLLRETE